MLYGRFGGEVEIVREGTLDDVRKLDGRKPDKQDRDAIANGSYVVIRHVVPATQDGMRETLCHLSYLRADGAFPEIVEAMRSAGIVNKVTAPE
jgi:hypothetical protein